MDGKALHLFEDMMLWEEATFIEMIAEGKRKRGVTGRGEKEVREDRGPHQHR